MTALIPVHKGFKKNREIVAYALVDNEDAARIQEHVWMMHSNGYAERRPTVNGRQVHVYMHDEVLGVVGVDHVSGHKLDNRKGNLRKATVAENAQNQVVLRSDNSSGFRGVHFFWRTRKWQAYGNLRGKRTHLGYYATAESAAAAAARWRAENMPFATK